MFLLVRTCLLEAKAESCLKQEELFLLSEASRIWLALNKKQKLACLNQASRKLLVAYLVKKLLTICFKHARFLKF